MKNLKDSLAIMLGAMSGGWLRYQLGLTLVLGNSFPLASLVANYLGTAFLVYGVKGYLASRQVSQRLLLALSVGFCGGLTTFSGLLLDSLKLADIGRYGSLALYLLLSLGGGLLIALLAGKKVAS